MVHPFIEQPSQSTSSLKKDFLQKQYPNVTDLRTKHERFFVSFLSGSPVLLRSCEAATAHAPFLPAPVLFMSQEPRWHGPREAGTKERSRAIEGGGPQSGLDCRRVEVNNAGGGECRLSEGQVRAGEKVLDWINAVDLQNIVLHCTTVSKSKRQTTVTYKKPKNN